MHQHLSNKLTCVAIGLAVRLAVAAAFATVNLAQKVRQTECPVVIQLSNGIVIVNPGRPRLAGYVGREKSNHKQM